MRYEKPVMRRVRVVLDRKQVVFLRFLLEGYDGLATISTVDRWGSTVDLFVCHEQLEELQGLLRAVQSQLGIASVEVKGA
jgi:hypothetical protein